MQFFKIIHLTEKAVSELMEELKNFQIPFNLELAKEITAEKSRFYLSLSKKIDLKQFSDWKKYLIPSRDYSILCPQGVHLITYLKPKQNSNLKFGFWNLEITNKVGEGYAIQYCFNPKEKSHEVNLRATASSKNFSRTSELLFQVTMPFAIDFKIIKPRTIGEGIIDYTNRKFQEKYKFLV